MSLALALTWHRWSSALLGLCLLNVDTPSVDLSNLLVLNQVLGNRFLFEGDESEPTRLARVNVIQNNRVLDLAELAEVLFQAFLCQFKVQTAHENLTLRVCKRNFVILTFWVVGVTALVVALAFVVDDHVRIRLLNLLSVLSNVHLLPVVSVLLVMLALVTATTTEVAASLWPWCKSTFRLAALVIFS